MATKELCKHALTLDAIRLDPATEWLKRQEITETLGHTFAHELARKLEEAVEIMRTMTRDHRDGHRLAATWLKANGWEVER